MQHFMIAAWNMQVSEATSMESKMLKICAKETLVFVMGCHAAFDITFWTNYIFRYSRLQWPTQEAIQTNLSQAIGKAEKGLGPGSPPENKSREHQVLSKQRYVPSSAAQSELLWAEGGQLNPNFTTSAASVG